MGDLPDWQTHVNFGDDTVLSTVTLAAGATTPVLDVSSYQSILVTTSQALQVVAQSLTAVWEDVNGSQITFDFVTAPADALGVVIPDLWCPVRAPKVFIRNDSTVAQTITVMGTNRVISGLIGEGFNDIQTMQTGNIAMGANTSYDVGGGYVGSQGVHWLDMTISNTAQAGDLYFQCASQNGVTIALRLANSVEAQTVGTILEVHKQIILPASAGKLRWLARASNTANVIVNLAALGH